MFRRDCFNTGSSCRNLRLLYLVEVWGLVYLNAENGSELFAQPGNDHNIMVAITYTPDSNIAAVTAKNPVTGDRTTRYQYGTTLGGGPGGFDQFGRVVDLPWSQSSTGDLARLKYGYDLAGNRTFRQDMAATDAEKAFDELYSYDGIQRLIAAARGKFSSPPSPLTGDSPRAAFSAPSPLTGEGRGEGDPLPPITTPTLQQGWTLDATGNWSGFNSFDFTTAANSVVQQRASNAANEITAIGATVGDVWQTPAYDRNGNMTTIPQPFDLTAGYTGIWDAWNRLMALKSGSNYVMSFLYDGLNRRGLRDSYDGSGTLTESRFFTYSEQWQILEEYVGGESTTPVIQWVWGLRYIDDCVLRDRSVSGGTLNERLFALQDANWNVVALYDPSADDGAGAPVERYAYTPYGVVLFLAEDFTPLSGNVSAYAWETLYCGYRYDGAIGLYIVRNRWLIAALGCWLSDDPLPSLSTAHHGYTYGDLNPVMMSDPSGLAPAVLDWLVRLLCGVYAHAEIVRVIKGANKGKYHVEGNLEIQTLVEQVSGASSGAFAFDPTS